MTEDADHLHPPSSSPVLAAFKEFEPFCKCLLDPYIVVDASGTICKSTAGFAQLVGLGSKQILKIGALSAVLQLAVGGKVFSLADALTAAGPTRLDEVSGSSSERQNLKMIIAVYPFHRDGQALGAFLMFRDVTAETNLQDRYTVKAKDSITDTLTGLFNRAYFTEYMATQLTALESFPETAAQRLISVVMLDIDFFKKINDGYGHLAGDFVLKKTSDLMRELFRKSDIVARYGGEEFLAILPGTDAHGACIATEKFRRAVQAFRFEFDGKTIQATISIGVAQINIGHETGEQAIARADLALYFSKSSGRNRVSLHDGTAPKPSAVPRPS